MIIVDIKGKLHDKDVLGILSQSMYMPTEEKLNLRADEYEADESVSVLAHVDGEIVIGVIVVKALTAVSFEILSIAVESAFRGKGVGSKLISSFIENFSCREICAETDVDAVGFYRNFGFEINSLGEKYPGVIRYLCTLKLS